MFYKQEYDFLMLARYLEAGLVPVSGFFPEEIENFQAKLQSLSPEERRVATRKFRKQWRKIERRLSTAESEELSNHVEAAALQRSRRRRAVHKAFVEEEFQRHQEWQDAEKLKFQKKK